MSNNHSLSKTAEAAMPFAKSIGIVLAFSPWLLVAYALVTSHAVTLKTNDQDAIRGFIEWFGTAYSFFLGLALVNVWAQFDAVDREFDRELDALSSLYQTVEYTKVEVSPPDRTKQAQLTRFKRNVRREIKDYVHHVIQNHKFEHRVHEQQRRGARILENIGSHIGDLTSKKVVPEPFISELFQSLNESLDARGDRISRSGPYTPAVVKVMAVTTSAIWLFSFLGLVIYDRAFAIALVGGAAFVIIMVLVIFFDLGEPFGGIWKIHLSDWPDFLENINRDKDPEVVFIYNLHKTVFNGLFTRQGMCKLSDLMHSKCLGVSLEQFLVSVQRVRTNRQPRINCKTLYKSEIQEQGLPVTNQDWPLVVLKRASDLDVVLNSQQINACHDLPAFTALFHAEMRKHLRWYTP